MKSALFLFVQIQSKAETGGINPTLTELAQTPCSLVLRQGICDLRQLRGIVDCSKAVVLFSEADSGFLRLTSHVFVTVQHYLRPERRMTAHFDR
jgi:hypothetical protein